MSVLENFNESMNAITTRLSLSIAISSRRFHLTERFVSFQIFKEQSSFNDLISVNTVSTSRGFLHLSIKEVIQPHLPVRLPCYDFTPVMKPTVDAVLLAVKQTSSGEPHSHGVTGGVYKTRERIHRGMLIRDY